MKIQKKIPDNLRGYDMILNEICLFNQKFMKEKKDEDEQSQKNGSSLSRSTISRNTLSRSKRRGTDMGGIYSPMIMTNMIY